MRENLAALPSAKRLNVREFFRKKPIGRFSYSLKPAFGFPGCVYTFYKDNQYTKGYKGRSSNGKYSTILDGCIDVVVMKSIPAMCALISNVNYRRSGGTFLITFLILANADYAASR